VPPRLFDGMEACVLGADAARAELCMLLKAGGAKLMTSKNTLDDGVLLFTCDTTNARFRVYAALDAPNRPDIMHSRCRPPLTRQSTALTPIRSYVTDCIAARTLRDPQPKFYALTCAATAMRLAKDYDQWGDADSEDLDLEVLPVAQRFTCFGDLLGEIRTCAICYFAFHLPKNRRERNALARQPSLATVSAARTITGCRRSSDSCRSTRASSRC
jgi:hypothetical protein